MPINSVVELKLPSSGIVKFADSTDAPSCEFMGIEGTPELTNCQIEDIDGRQQITWTVPDAVPPALAITFYAKEIFNNPPSTEPTDTFEMRSYSDNTKQTLLDQQLIDLVFQAVVEPLPSDNAFFTSIDTGEVSKATKVQLNLINNIPIPHDSIITIDMPKMNIAAPRSLRKSYVVDSDNIICTAIQNVDRGLKCVFENIDSENDRLTITDILPDGVTELNQQMIIEIDSFFNPFSMTERLFFTTISTVSDLDGKIYGVQEGYTSFKATTPTSISSVKITSSDTTVQEYVTFTFEFRPDVDILAGATAMVQFPTGGDISQEVILSDLDEDAQFIFDQELQQISTIGGMFGSSQSNVPFSKDNTNLKIQTKVGTSRYATQSTAKMIIGLVKNPVHVGSFGSFRISIFDEDYNLIADSYEGYFYEVTQGNIIDVEMYTQDSQISQTSRLGIYFNPLHQLDMQASIVIQIDRNIAVTCPTEFNFNSDQLDITDVDCDFASNPPKFTFKSPFKSDYKHIPGDHNGLEIVFAEAKMPRMAVNIDTLIIYTTTEDGEIVDYYSSSITHFQVQPAPFRAQSVTTLSDETYTETGFDFQFTLAEYHLPYDVIDFHLPEEVNLPDRDLFTSQGYSVEVIDDKVLRIANFVRLTDRAKNSGEIIEFGILNMITPRTTVSSSSFKVYTRDQDENIINYVETDLFVTMLYGKKIQGAKVSTSDTVVGNIASHIFTFNTPIPLISTDMIMVQYPNQTSPPLQPNLCSGLESLDDEQSCYVIEKIVQTNGLALRPDQDLFAVTQVAEGEKVVFSVEGSTNPKSSELTDGYKLWIKDRNGNVMSETITGNVGMRLKAGTAASIISYNFERTDERQLAITALELSWTSVMPYPEGSYLQLNIYSKEIGPEPVSGKGKVKCSSNLQLEVECQFITDDKIEVRQMFVEDLVPGSFVTFMITNFYVDISEPTLTKSWTMNVYTKDGYRTDAINEGLEFIYPCSVPCQTCSETNPLQCTKCNVLTNKTILWQEQCYEKCPSGTFYDAQTYTCKKCNSMCLECDDYNGDICLTCNPFSDFPFLDGVDCKAKCPFGTYGNLETAQCEKCQAPCQSCTNGPLDCNTCDIKSVNSYYMNGVCQDKCNDGYTVPLGFEDFTCQKCNANCGTCIGDLSFCTTCKSTGKTLLSDVDNKCYSVCPQGVTVQVTKGGKKSCQGCDDICATCKGRSNVCTSCKPGYYLNGSKCVKECSELKKSNKLYKYVNFEADRSCKACDFPCDQCQERSDHCLSCDDGLLMFGYKCVAECPDQYSARDGKCVLTGFFCKFGYEMNAKGDACFLKAQICEGNDILNYDKTKCIPQPGFMFPFPLVILAIIGTVFIVQDKRKNPQARFYPSMISMLSILETVGLISIYALSSDYGITPASNLSGMAMVFLIGLNLFSFIIYQQQLKNDSAFKYWEQEFSNSTIAIVGLGLLGNFKFQRMFYSRLGGKRDFEAVFTDEIIFYRALTFATCVYIITGMVPTIISGIFGIVYVRYGYQLQMFCIEMVMIEFVLLVLMSIEMYKVRKYFLTKNFFKVSKKQMGSGKQFKVMAGVPEQYSRANSDTVAILQKLLQRINVRDAGIRKQGEYTTIKEIQDLHEEEFRNHQLRRCISFREYQNENDEFQQMLEETDEDEPMYNFISEPSSPRSKEMLLNPNFNNRMGELTKVYHMRDQYANCYHEAKPLHQYGFTNCKVASRAVQTNVLELLGVDDLLPRSSKHKKKRGMNQKIDEVSIDESLDGVDDLGHSLVSNVLNNFEGFQEKKKRKRLPPARMRALPPFEINDIIGNFDIDEEGNYMIIGNGEDQWGEPILEDIDGHRVNKRGYLTNQNGQIVLRDATIVFRKEEVDEDGEIPAPFCYMKSGFGEEEGDNAMVDGKPPVVPEQDEEEDMVEQEYQKLRKEDSRSSDEDADAAIAPSKQIKRQAPQQELVNPNDEDYLTQASRMMKPMAKKKLVKPLPAALKKQKTEIDGANSSIDQDFFINGNINEDDNSIMNKINETFDRGNYPADMSIGDGSKTVPVSIRPNTGNATGSKLTKKRKQGVLKKDQKSLLLDTAKDREQEIINGIEKFQNMLARYPLKPKKQKSSNTLANRNINKVYGKIQRQFTQQIHKQESQGNMSSQKPRMGSIMQSQISQSSLKKKISEYI